MKNLKQLIGLFLAIVLASSSAVAQQSAAASTTPETKPEFRRISPGVEYTQITRRLAVNEAGNGPWSINALRIDPKIARLRFVRALDEGVGLETVSSLAARHGALAGLNAGFFRTTGPFRGESMGLFLLEGKLLSEPHNDRIAVGLINQVEINLIFGYLKFSAAISTRNFNQIVNGFNRPVGDDEVVVFTPEFHRTTLTTPEVLEIIVGKDKVISISDQVGSNLIPADGFVITAKGTARANLLAHTRRGSHIKLQWKLDPVDSTQAVKWSQASSITAGGPQLIKDGKIFIPNEREEVTQAFVGDRHPRTAIAKLNSGQILLLTVDGRQTSSVGMSLPGLAGLLLEFGATEAINLDGGGSTTMVVSNKVVNRPSDQTGERPVSDAILVFSRTK